MNTLTLLPGKDKQGRAEPFSSIELRRGEICTIVGNTGSGKSRLIKDVEQLADGTGVTSRRVLLDGEMISAERRQAVSTSLVAHLGQNKRFVLDTDVGAFIRLHAACRNRSVSEDEVIAVANSITPEPIAAGDCLNLLSGGQTRALMIADIALVCDSPIVLVDEIENAGIDKTRALSLLQSRDKLVLVVTHDPHTALMAPRRLVMAGGAVKAALERTAEEAALFNALSLEYARSQRLQTLLRKGETLA